RSMFHSGGLWMKAALEHVRGAPLPGSAHSLQPLGFVKYALASLGALAPAALAWQLGEPLILLGCVPVFYAIEAQVVFRFQLALDGEAAPFRTAWAWTRRAGGTLAVMRVVLPLAAVMLFGGFLGSGFVRCWSLGCLAVCLWYEAVRAGRRSGVAL